MTPSASPIAAALVDAHVHIHDCFPLGEFLDHAHANFTAAAGRLGVRGGFAGILMLTESERDDWFGRLRDAALDSGSDGDPDAGGWTFHPTEEPVSLEASRGSRVLYLVAGRQVAAAEDLEVLLLGTCERVPDGLPIRRALDLGEACGAIRVVPWGAGKWLFARGKLLSELLGSADPESFCLGDESSRPFFWPTPRHFREARRRGIRVLPGTDPLPFPREVGRAGSYGFRVAGRLDPRSPAASVRALVRDPTVALEGYGPREGPIGFLRNQLAMQLRKRKRHRERRRMSPEA